MKLAGLSGSMKDKKETERGWTSGGIEGGTLDENKSLDEQTEEAEAKVKQVSSNHILRQTYHSPPLTVYTFGHVTDKFVRSTLNLTNHEFVKRRILKFQIEDMIR